MLPALLSVAGVTPAPEILKLPFVHERLVLGRSVIVGKKRLGLHLCSPRCGSGPLQVSVHPAPHCSAGGSLRPVRQSVTPRFPARFRRVEHRADSRAIRATGASGASAADSGIGARPRCCAPLPSGHNATVAPLPQSAIRAAQLSAHLPQPTREGPICRRVPLPRDCPGSSPSPPRGGVRDQPRDKRQENRRDPRRTDRLSPPQVAPRCGHACGLPFGLRARPDRSAQPCHGDDL